MREYIVNINGIEVKAHFSEENTENIFIPLLRSFKKMQEEKGKRILVMLAAPPGAGKSTLLSFLEYLSSSEEGLQEIQIIGMDGFHRRQEYLLTHTAIRDGKEVNMVDIKGAPITFDIDLLRERIESIAAGDNCGWPVYNRHLHNPTDNVITVNKDIVMLEGNYLLLNEEGWRELSDFADYTIRIIADESMLSERLLQRRIDSGHPETESRRFVEFSDMYNARLCLHNSLKADLTLHLQGNGEFAEKDISEKLPVIMQSCSVR